MSASRRPSGKSPPRTPSPAPAQQPVPEGAVNMTDGGGEAAIFADMQELLSSFGAEQSYELVGIVGDAIDSDVNLFVEDREPHRPWILTMESAHGATGIELQFPMTADRFW